MLVKERSAQIHGKIQCCGKQPIDRCPTIPKANRARVILFHFTLT